MCEVCGFGQEGGGEGGAVDAVRAPHQLPVWGDGQAAAQCSEEQNSMNTNSKYLVQEASRVESGWPLSSHTRSPVLLLLPRRQCADTTWSPAITTCHIQRRPVNVHSLERSEYFLIANFLQSMCSAAALLIWVATSISCWERQPAE